MPLPFYWCGASAHTLKQSEIVGGGATARFVRTIHKLMRWTSGQGKPSSGVKNPRFAFSMHIDNDMPQTTLSLRQASARTEVELSNREDGTLLL